MEKDRNRRYGTAEALADDLERYLQGEPVVAPATERRLPHPQAAASTPVAASLAVAVFVSLLVGVVANWSLYRESRSIAGELRDQLHRTQAVMLAHAAREELERDPSLATLLAYEGASRMRTLTTDNALRASLERLFERRRLPARSGTIENRVLRAGRIAHPDRGRRFDRKAVRRRRPAPSAPGSDPARAGLRSDRTPRSSRGVGFLCHRHGPHRGDELVPAHRPN